jgi:hypothetical protein
VDAIDPAIAALSVLGGDDGGEANLTYTWRASGPGPVVFAANGTHDARQTTVTVTEHGTYTFTVTITDQAGQSVEATVVVVQGVALVDDNDLYVRRGRFTVDWRKHKRGKSSDKLRVIGHINPARLPLDMTGVVVALAVNGDVVAEETLDASGWHRPAPGEQPAVTVRVLPQSGRYRVRVTHADLRDVLAVANADADGTMVVPVTLTVSRAQTMVAHNRLEFVYRSRTDRRTRGVWRGPRQRLLDGAFKMMRTRARVSRRTEAYVVRMKGVAYPVGSGPVTPTGDVRVRIAEAPDMVIPLASLQRVGTSPETMVYRYLSADRDALLSLFRIRNGKRRIDVRLGTIAPLEFGMPDGVPVGTRADLPIRIDVPTADGVLRLQTTVELVHRLPGVRWRRPAPLDVR